MRRISSTISAMVLLVLALLAEPSQAQNKIVTVAGGGPNDLPATASSIGNPDSAAEDSAGNIYFADSFSSRVFKVDTVGNLTVVAGNGVAGYSGDGGLAVNAELSSPEGVFVDNFGNIFIADGGNSLIREVSAGTGVISTVAGTPGSFGYGGDSGPATSAVLDFPTGVCVDTSGDIFIADTENSIIREVWAGSGNITTVAGTPGSSGYSGDGGLAPSALLYNPQGVSVDGEGNIFIADTGNSVVREVSKGNIQTVAGNGNVGYSGDGGPAMGAELNYPASVFVDNAENLFIADTDNQVIREVVSSTGNIQTVAGNGNVGYSGDGGPAMSAELNYPASVFVDNAENLFIADTDNWAIREVVFSTSTISTYAGNGSPTYSGDSYPATNAEIYGPEGVAINSSGNIFIADTGNNVVREVNATTGIIQTVAGNGVQGYTGDGGPATSAELFYPTDVVVDNAGNLLIADAYNSVVREVAYGSGIISTVAGTPGVPGYTGDQGPATSASLNYPCCLAVDNSGNIFISDTYNNVIREVSAGIITTVAGTGTSGYNGDHIPATTAELGAEPLGVFVDDFGNLFIADESNQRIREVVAHTGNIQTVAGNGTAGYSGDGGPATSAMLNYPWGVYLDAAGNIFISDQDNSRIRKVDAATKNIQTVAGNGVLGLSGDDGPALAAELTQPLGMAGDRYGNLLVADSLAQRIRRIASLVATPPNVLLSPSSLAFSGQTVGTASALKAVTISIPSGTSLIFGSITVTGTNAGDFSQTNNCGLSIPSDSSCTISVTFAPSATGSRSAVIRITDNAVASPQQIALSGSGIVRGSGVAPGFSLTVSALSAASVTAGQSSTATVNLGSAGGFNSKVSLTCAVTPSSSTSPTCSLNPTSVTPTSAGTTSTLTITTTASTAALALPDTDHQFRGLYSAWILFPAVLLSTARNGAARRKRLLCCLLPLLALGACLFMSACAGGSSGNGSGSGGGTGGTSAGPYTINVTATGGSIKHTASAQLTVQ